jgi:hypothetical protein
MRGGFGKLVTMWSIGHPAGRGFASRTGFRQNTRIFPLPK